MFSSPWMQWLIPPALNKCPFVTSASLKLSCCRQVTTTPKLQASKAAESEVMRDKLYWILNDQKPGRFLKNCCKRNSSSGASVLSPGDGGLGVGGKASYLGRAYHRGLGAAVFQTNCCLWKAQIARVTIPLVTIKY